MGLIDKKTLAKESVKAIGWLLVGVLSAGGYFTFEFMGTKLQVGQLTQVVEALAPDNPILKQVKP